MARLERNERVADALSGVTRVGRTTQYSRLRIRNAPRPTTTCYSTIFSHTAVNPIFASSYM